MALVMPSGDRDRAQNLMRARVSGHPEKPRSTPGYDPAPGAMQLERRGLSPVPRPARGRYGVHAGWARGTRSRSGRYSSCEQLDAGSTRRHCGTRSRKVKWSGRHQRRPRENVATSAGRAPDPVESLRDRRGGTWIGHWVDTGSALGYGVATGSARGRHGLIRGERGVRIALGDTAYRPPVWRYLQGVGAEMYLVGCITGLTHTAVGRSRRRIRWPRVAYSKMWPRTAP
jgi:hypothetical protein